MTDAGDFSLEELDAISQDPVIITVAGHTNHGKTTTVRSLTRRPHFGSVSPEPGTTTEIHAQRFHMLHKTFLMLFDTPGFERAGDALSHCGFEFDVDCVAQFFASDRKYQLEQAVLKQVRQSDVVLYVVDVRQRVLEKYQDEFRLLSRSEVPVVPVLNFVAATDNRRDEWEAWFRKNNYHSYTPYDAFQHEPPDEEALFRQIQAYLKTPLHRRFVEVWINEGRARLAKGRAEAIRSIAEMLVDVAAFRLERKGVPPAEKAKTARELTTEFARLIMAREAATHRQIVRGYDFDEDLVENAGHSGQAEPVWSHDLFGPEMQKHAGMGIRAGAAAGAVTGGAIDAMVGGLTFLTGAFVGAALGALAGAFAAGFYNMNYDVKTQRLSFRAEDPTLKLLLGRCVALSRRMHRRGHGNPKMLVVDEKLPKLVNEKEILELLHTARSQFQATTEETNLPRVPQWKRTPRYQELLNTLKDRVAVCLNGNAAPVASPEVGE